MLRIYFGMYLETRDGSSNKYLRDVRTSLTNQNSIPEEIKSRLRPGNACYHSVHYLLSSRLLFKNLKIKIYSTIILLFCTGVNLGCHN